MQQRKPSGVESDSIAQDEKGDAFGLVSMVVVASPMAPSLVVDGHLRGEPGKVQGVRWREKGPDAVSGPALKK
jgi:hypothetical protein